MEKIFENVSNNVSLIHSITNYVTVNDVANVILASKASPIMADEKQEVSEITNICDALLLNIGTLNERVVTSMMIAGETANKKGIPIIFDPVGAGASTYRSEVAKNIVKTLHPTIIRGNVSEIKALFTDEQATRGVDASDLDIINDSNLEESIKMVAKFAREAATIIVVSSEYDLISDGSTTYVVKNGCSEMSKITGTGCMLSAVVASYVAANVENTLKAAMYAVAIVGFSGELASFKAAGFSSMKMHFIDEISKMDVEVLKKGIRYEKA